MATISTRTTGTKITASIWNDDLVTPINDYETRISAIEAGVLVRYSQTALQTVSNTTAETTLSTVSLAINEFRDDDLNWNNRYQFRFVGRYTDSVSGATNATWRIKLGSSTGVIQDTGAVNGAQFSHIVIDGEVWATAQSAQVWSAIVKYVQSAATSPANVTATRLFYTTSAENGGTALNLISTVQLTTGAADPGRVMYQDSFIVKGPIALKTS